jgi:hypothetical protein
MRRKRTTEPRLRAQFDGRRVLGEFGARSANSGSLIVLKLRAREISSHTIRAAAGRRQDLYRAHNCRPGWCSPADSRYKSATRLRRVLDMAHSRRPVPCIPAAAVPGSPAIAVAIGWRRVILSICSSDGGGDSGANQGACQSNLCCRMHGSPRLVGMFTSS